MARGRKAKDTDKDIKSYEHKGKERLNNPPVGLVTPASDKPTGKKKYEYDPHLDPQLVWAGKKERLSFEVPTVSLHVHERIDPLTIIDAVRKKKPALPKQISLFEQPEENPPLRQAIDFYKHAHNWSNRMIAGDSLQVMNSLLEKEGMAGKIQMIYIDPPYGIKYGSNFQPFVNKRDVKDGKDDDLNQEPEMIRAFRDTWELGIHSYLTYLRDRLLLSRELLNESGSIFVQISDENLPHVLELMNEVFGFNQRVSTIPFIKTVGKSGSLLDSTNDYLLWYAKDIDKLKYNQLYKARTKKALDQGYTWIELDNATRRRLTSKEIQEKTQMPKEKRFITAPLVSQSGGEKSRFKVEHENRIYEPSKGTFWKTNPEGMSKLLNAKRLIGVKNTLAYVRFSEDFEFVRITNWWDDTKESTFSASKLYVVQTYTKVIERCLLMTTAPGDLVIDPTCGSGTTAFVAEKWGRRWITCDTSRVAITLAKQRLMTAVYDYYSLAYPNEGIGSGFIYKTVPHITLKSIANNPEIKEGMTKLQIDDAIKRHAPQETLYDQPEVETTKSRVTGPFTVEAVPAPVVKPISDIDTEPETADESVARDGETLRQGEWRDGLLKSGIRAKGGKRIEFTRIEPIAGTRWLHADGETKEDKPVRAVISFGPESAPLEQRQVELAWEEARTLNPKPAMIVFASFHFDPEASKDIDELTEEKTGMTFLKVQMNTDLLVEDLKKKPTGSDSFWLIGQPDVELRKVNKGEDKGKFEVEIHGFDYYNPQKGTIQSGDTSKIAMWMIDTNYDGRSLYPSQVFFPMAGAKDGWAKLAKSLQSEIDEDLIEAYRGTTSRPFESGKNKRVAVKIVDDRGIESLKIMDIE